MIRTVDVLLAIVVGLVFLPILTFVFLLDLVKPGFFLFRQSRIGRYKEPFVIYKLRTMPFGTVQGETRVVMAGWEVQPLAIYRWLRKMRLDEIPQVLNILKGDMSWVGPRPCLPSQLDLVKAREELKVFSLRPGLAGPAQAAGLDMSQPLKVAEADAILVGEAMGLTLYFRYLVRSVWITFTRRG